jgi:hypothetical protein
LLGDVKSIVYLNPEITDGALQFCMAEEELDSTKFASLALDLSDLHPPHRMGTIGDFFQTDAINPAMHQSGVLSGR